MARVKIPFTVVDLGGNAVQGASVTITRRADGGPATLYQSETGPTTAVNPATTNTQGRISAWVERGSYLASIRGTGIADYDEYFEATPGGDRSIDEPWLPQGGLPTWVSALPTTPSDGQEIYYTPLASPARQPWHLRYNASLGDSSKWEYVGGSALSMESVGPFTFSTLSAVTDLAGMSVTVPLPGYYDIELGGRVAHTGTNQGAFLMANGAGISASTGGLLVAASGQPVGTGGGAASVYARGRAVLTAGPMRLTYWVGASGGSAVNTFLSVTPYRLG